MTHGINPFAARKARPIEVQESGQKIVRIEQPVAQPKLQVPVGSISEVLAWVGDDSERAELALTAETANLGRKSLVKKLKELVASVEDDTVEADVAEAAEPAGDDDDDATNEDEDDAIAAFESEGGHVE